MEPMKLNFGGILGVLLGGGLSGTFLYLQPVEQVARRSTFQILMAGLVIGAIAGNLLWAWITKRANKS